MQPQRHDQKKHTGTRTRTRKVRSYPVHPLRDALAVPQAIQDVNSGVAFDRILLAGELNTTPSSSGFTMRLNSSARYGLTVGGYNDAMISLTEAGRAVVAPTSEEERRLALVECVLRPDVFRAFYERLDGKRLPEAAFAANILERDHRIDPELTKECLEIITANGVFVGLLREVGGSLWIGVKGVRTPSIAPAVAASSPANAGSSLAPVGPPDAEPLGTAVLAPAPPGRVFVGHFGSPTAAAMVQALLSDFGIEHTTVDVGLRASAPMPAEVSGTMRQCSSAILVSGAGPADKDAVSASQLGFMVGAASVLYGPRLVVLTGKQDDDLTGLSVRTVALADGDDGAAALELLMALNESGVIRITS